MHEPDPENLVLSVQVDAEEVSSVRAHEAPVEKFVVVERTHRDQAIRFIDSKGCAHSYLLELIDQEREKFLHLSIRVGPTFAVQTDALLTKDGQNPEETFSGPDGKAIRFEPFYLPECSGDPADLVGRGLFHRGLHYAGTVTPLNVSLLCICDHCKKIFRLQPFHAGFSDLTYLYCSQDMHTLVVDSRLDDAPPVLVKTDAKSVARFENKLPPCSECGGTFRYMNPLRCPHCKEPYIDFQKYPGSREQEYYGNHLYGGTLQRFEPDCD